MNKKLILILLSTFIFAGCASVPMKNKEESNQAKSFSPPPDGQAGIYIYRGGGPGTAIKKDVWLDNDCVGETAPYVFFYVLAKGGDEYTVSTESEFSENRIQLKTEPGNNYFIKQYLKMGLFVGGANLEIVDNEKGMKDVSDLDLAVMGTCSRPGKLHKE